MRSSSPSRWKVRTKVWLEDRDGYVFGYGVAQILTEVERTGALTLAARRLGRSYRYVWRRVRDCEQALGLTLVVSRVGGAGRDRSKLTGRARRLLRSYLALRRDVQRSARLAAAPARGRWGHDCRVSG